LEADWIIHAVGPRFQEDSLEEKLRRTVESVLIEASKLNIKSIAFPPMGTGFYGIPLEMCARVLVETVRNFIRPDTSLEEVVICVLDNREEKPFAERLQNSLQEAVI
jgi:O-acetyl-ADP-ribose deacetylase (regulator of RNase III)